MISNNTYNRLLELKDLIDKNSATSQQKSEYIELLYENGNINENQYKAFLNNQNTDEIIKAALTIGGVVLAAWLISKLLE
jgi:hypothetical protein